MQGGYSNNSCATGETDFSINCPGGCVGMVTSEVSLELLNETLGGMDEEDEGYDTLVTERNLLIGEMVNYYAGVNAQDSAAWLLEEYSKYAEALPYYIEAGLWTDAYTAQGNLPTGTDDEQLYAWLAEKFIDLYSNDQTWDDLDSASKDSLTHIEQLDSYAGGLSGGLAELLGVGNMAWFFPDFDTTFVLPEANDTLEEGDIEERLANAQNEWQTPGITNMQAGGKAKFSLYPNPSIGNFIVECTAAGKLAILTLEGKLVGEYDMKNGKNDVQLPRGLSGGVYTIRYKPDGGIPENKKLIYQP